MKELMVFNLEKKDFLEDFARRQTTRAPFTTDIL